MFVYLITDGEYVKIGQSIEPERRLREIQAASPRQLDLIACIPQDTIKERDLHRWFDAYRQNGEWFVMEGGVEGFCEWARRRYAPDSIQSDISSPPQMEETPDSEGWIEWTARTTKTMGKRRYPRYRKWEWDSVAQKWVKSAPISCGWLEPVDESEYIKLRNAGVLPT